MMVNLGIKNILTNSGFQGFYKNGEVFEELHDLFPIIDKEIFTIQRAAVIYLFDSTKI